MFVNSTQLSGGFLYLIVAEDGLRILLHGLVAPAEVAVCTSLLFTARAEGRKWEVYTILLAHDFYVYSHISQLFYNL